MKPLKIVVSKDIDNQDDPGVVAFVRPDAVSIAMHVKGYPDLCGITTRDGGKDIYTIIKEPLLEFVARWELALM